MKIAVMGSGGVGGFVGGRLANAGCDVRFIARGAHLAALRGHGLNIENEAQGNIHVPKVRFSDDPAALGPVDLVLIVVKLRDTDVPCRPGYSCAACNWTAGNRWLSRYRCWSSWRIR